MKRLDLFIDIYYDLTKALGVMVEPNFGLDRAGDIKVLMRIYLERKNC